MRYTVQPRNRIFVKAYGFLSFAKNMAKIIGKNKSKHLSGKYVQKFLGNAKISATNALKISSRRVTQKRAEAIGDLVDNKIANKSQMFQKIHNKIIQKQLQSGMMKKYLKKDIYLKKDKKVLMI